MTSLVYTGIGSRETPADVLALMKAVGASLANAGVTLRSGGAQGADSAFESGCLSADGAAEIYLPKAGHMGHRSSLNTVCDAAMRLASQIHPNWSACSPLAKRLHARNCYQVLGKSLDHPADLLICWTPDGCVDELTRTRQSGGTATAICLASLYQVPVINLMRPRALSQLDAWCVAKGIDASFSDSSFSTSAQSTLF